MIKFQLDFSKIPTALRQSIATLVASELTDNGWDFSAVHQNLLTKHRGDMYIIFGDRADCSSEWNPTAYHPLEYTVYHPVNDWDKWTTIIAKSESETRTFELNSQYTAVIQKNGDVEVGCQTFPYKLIQELAHASEQFKIDNR